MVNTTIYIYLHVNSYTYHNKDSLFLKMSLVSRKFQSFASRTLSHRSTLILVFRCQLRNPRQLSSTSTYISSCSVPKLHHQCEIIVFIRKRLRDVVSSHLQSQHFLHPSEQTGLLPVLLKNCTTMNSAPVPPSVDR